MAKMPGTMKMKVEFDGELFCYGCAHSAASESFPGSPSDERPCCFCVRNMKCEDSPVVDKWYDGSSPVSVPMDCYHSLDMKRQFEQWDNAK